MMQKLKMHPDLGGDHESAALINEAFAVLSDPKSRADYDARGAAAVNPTAPAEDAEQPGYGSGDVDRPGDPTGTAAGTGFEESRLDPDPDPTSDNCLFCSARCRSIQHREPDDVCGNCSAPLYPAEQRRFEVDSQRAIERFPTHTTAAFSVTPGPGLEHQGLVQDISLNGLQLRAASELRRNQIVLIRTDVLYAVARVINSRRLTADSATLWRVGLVFLTMKLNKSRGSFISVDA